MLLGPICILYRFRPKSLLLRQCIYFLNLIYWFLPLDLDLIAHVILHCYSNKLISFSLSLLDSLFSHINSNELVYPQVPHFTFQNTMHMIFLNYRTSHKGFYNRFKILDTKFFGLYNRFIILETNLCNHMSIYNRAHANPKVGHKKLTNIVSRTL